MRNEKYLKPKIKSYECKINTWNVERSLPFSLPVINNINLKMVKNYYRQVFLEVFKHIFKEKKISLYITDNF